MRRRGEGDGALSSSWKLAMLEVDEYRSGCGGVRLRTGPDPRRSFFYRNSSHLIPHLLMSGLRQHDSNGVCYHLTNCILSAVASFRILNALFQLRHDRPTELGNDRRSKTASALRSQGSIAK